MFRLKDTLLTSIDKVGRYEKLVGTKLMIPMEDEEIFQLFTRHSSETNVSSHFLGIVDWNF